MKQIISFTSQLDKQNRALSQNEAQWVCAITALFSKQALGERMTRSAFECFEHMKIQYTFLTLFR